jgi:hypothetical protein
LHLRFRSRDFPSAVTDPDGELLIDLEEDKAGRTVIWA